MNIIRKNMLYFKKLWQEAPLLAGLIFYSLFLSVYWTDLKLFFGSFETSWKIALLLIIPFVLWFYQVKQKANKKRARILTFREPAILPKHYIDQFKAILPNSQINLFEKVFLPTLSTVYKTFDAIGQLSYFKIKFDKLCLAINQLKSNATLYTNQSFYQRRNIAITAFIFYRILFDNLIKDYFHFLNSKEKEQANDDEFLLIKRVPEKLTQLLGAEYWRLYEFYEAVYGDLNELQLNADIKDELAIVFENSFKKSEEVQTPILADVADCFIKWLKNKIQSHQAKFQLNTGNFIFVSPLKFGNDTVFVKEALFNEYYRAQKVNPEELKQALSFENYLSEQSYRLKSNNENSILFKIASIHYSKTSYETVHIEEINQKDLSEEGI